MAEDGQFGMLGVETVKKRVITMSCASVCGTNRDGTGYEMGLSGADIYRA